MAAQKAVKKKPHKIKRKVPRIKKNVYHVKAIVPGRAWVEDARGFTVTVRVGDILNGGKVEMISPSQGMVVLSTGEIIQYGANDF